MALILLSSLSFTGSLSDSDSKIIDTTEAAAPAKATTPAEKAPTTTAPVAPAK
jgi:preprotein translocase subunit SecG